MGPFVPDVFSGELNYIIALIIGLAFGFILEQAGFSATRKLAGLFYGYDFTVLKVFFTAAIVALIGIIFFNYFGILNIDIIFVNPTFIPSALVGGAIMGLGFIIGGFCPGTSICAAVIGKIDAMFFIFGILVGIFFFTVSYPLVEDFYKAGNLGSILVFDSLGISRGLFVFLLILAAIGAFIFATYLEKRTNKAEEHPEKSYYKKYYATISLAVVISFILLFIPNWKTKIEDNAETMALSESQNINLMSADELAYKLIYERENFLPIDVRSEEEYKKGHLPTALNIPMDDITDKLWHDYIRNSNKTLVFYSDEMGEANQAYFVAKEFGKKFNYVLDKGLKHFNTSIMMAISKDDKELNTIQGKWDNRFRSRAKIALKELMKKESEMKKPKKKPTVRVVGGC